MSLIYIIIALLAGLIIGALCSALSLHRRHDKQLRERDAHIIELNAQRQAANDSQQALRDTFNALAGDALRKNNEDFLRLAKANLGQQQTEARAELDQRKQAIDALLKPINDTLEKTGQQIRDIEKERRQAYGSLTENLRNVAEAQQSLRSETHNLVSALRRPEVRGQWGEMSLRRLAELAGMVERCDFYEQESHDTDQGRLRPDMIVRMPDKRELIVDAKTPLYAYLDAIEADTDEARRAHLTAHARKVRERMKELATKAYWAQFDRSPDFVVLYIPGEQFLSTALEYDPSLLEDAFANKVILATPTTLVALLRAVAFGWRQQQLADNAENIRKLGEDMYQRISTFTGHLGKLGRSLGQSVGHFNKAVGSLERQVLPAARRFPEMGIETKKELDSPDPLEVAPRASRAIGSNADDTDSSID